ncbi:YtxH domain-containing protein [Bacillus sp. 31A1R]|uniref:YtxH domain-containing protein n=2 Tax=Robertmurraya mangrovi TaxID=3098077 RepID=A0ABU5J278_9BACI|nr:YtxH domain-containing protein [Bacillus sp. 31A1R]
MNRFWKGVFFGAIAGGAVALLDRETRQAVVENCKKTSSDVSYYIKNPNEMVEQVRETTQKIKTTFEQVSEDVSFIAEKVDELREVTPAVAGIVKETKEAFTHDEVNIEDDEENVPLP